MSFRASAKGKGAAQAATDNDDDDSSLLICPITCEPIVDPVVDPDGVCYEREAITSWLEKEETSPMTRCSLSSDQLSNLPRAWRHSSSSRYNAKTGKTMQLFVKTLSAKTKVVFVAPDASVVDLKQAIQNVEGIPLNEQRLISSGKQLVDGKSLADYKIQEQSTVYLLLRLAGGCGMLMASLSCF